MNKLTWKHVEVRVKAGKGFVMSLYLQLYSQILKVYGSDVDDVYDAIQRHITRAS